MSVFLDIRLVCSPDKKKAKKTREEALDFLHNRIMEGLPSVLAESGLVQDAGDTTDGKKKE